MLPDICHSIVIYHNPVHKAGRVPRSPVPERLSPHFNNISMQVHLWYPVRPISSPSTKVFLLLRKARHGVTLALFRRVLCYSTFFFFANLINLFAATGFICNSYPATQFKIKCCLELHEVRHRAWLGTLLGQRDRFSALVYIMSHPAAICISWVDATLLYVYSTFIISRLREREKVRERC